MKADHFLEGARVGDFPHDGGGSGCLRAYQIALVAFGACTAGKISVKGAQGHGSVCGGKALSDAGAAGGFEEPCTGGEQVGQDSTAGNHLEDLPAAGGDSKFHGGVNSASFEDFGGDHQISETGVGAAADDDLADFSSDNLLDRQDIVGGSRARRHGDQLREIKFNQPVIGCIGVSGQGLKVLRSVLGG